MRDDTKEILVLNSSCMHCSMDAVFSVEISHPPLTVTYDQSEAADLGQGGEGLPEAHTS